MRLLHIIATTLLVTAACSKADPAGPVEANPEKPTEPTKPADPTAGWVDYKGPDGSYTAKFPGTPTESTEKMPVEGAPEQTMKSALYESSGGSKAFITALVEVAIGPNDVYDAQKGLDGAVDGMLEGMGATKDTVKDVKWGAVAGKEVAYHGTTEGVAFKGIALVYASGGTKPMLYQANAISTTGEITSDLRLFLDNFALGISKDAPAEVKPADGEKPAEVKPADGEKPAEVKPADGVKPAEVKPADGEQPAEVKAADGAVPALPAGWVLHDTTLYSVHFPSKPSEQKNPLPTPLGDREMIIQTAATDTGAFLVASVDVKVPAGTEFSAAGAMEGMRDQLIKSVGGDPSKVKRAEVTAGTLKGEELAFTAEQKFEGKEIGGVMRVFVDEAGGKRIFALLSLGATPLDPVANKSFFDSFMPKP